MIDLFPMSRPSGFCRAEHSQHYTYASTIQCIFLISIISRNMIAIACDAVLVVLFVTINNWRHTPVLFVIFIISWPRTKTVIRQLAVLRWKIFQSRLVSLFLCFSKGNGKSNSVRETIERSKLCHGEGEVERSRRRTKSLLIFGKSLELAKKRQKIQPIQIMTII